MKRSEIIKQLANFIKQFEDSKLEKREAKKILDFLEKEINCNIEWEDEDV